MKEELDLSANTAPLKKKESLKKLTSKIYSFSYRHFYFYTFLDV